MRRRSERRQIALRSRRSLKEAGLSQLELGASQCAITGVRSRDFLVAAHIVPWSVDQKIRLDPSNGICLSLLVDRAFESGHLVIDDDLTMRLNLERVGDDAALRSLLEPYDGKVLKAPKDSPPNPEYLKRRRERLFGGEIKVADTQSTHDLTNSGGE